MRNIEVTTAVAQGDLSKKITVDVRGAGYRFRSGEPGWYRDRSAPPSLRSVRVAVIEHDEQRLEYDPQVQLQRPVAQVSEVVRDPVLHPVQRIRLPHGSH